MVAAIKERRAFAGGLLPSLRGATGPLIGLIVLCLFLTFATDKFMSVRNFLNVLDQITVLGVMAVGMTLVILIGGIDLAVGSVMALAMMVLGYLNVVLGVPMPLAISLALCAASPERIDRGIIDHTIQRAALHCNARDDVDCARHCQHDHRRPADHRFSRLVQHDGHRAFRRLRDIDGCRDGGGFSSLAFSISVTAMEAGYFMPSAETRKWHALPASMSSAPPFSSMWCAACSPALPAWCWRPGSIPSSRLRACPMNSTRIAAVVIGGTSLSGGTGGIGGTIIGVLIIGVLRNGLNLLSVSPFLQQVIIGAVIVLAVTAETYRKRK